MREWKLFFYIYDFYEFMLKSELPYKLSWRISSYLIMIIILAGRCPLLEIFSFPIDLHKNLYLYFSRLRYLFRYFFNSWESSKILLLKLIGSNNLYFTPHSNGKEEFCFYFFTLWNEQSNKRLFFIWTHTKLSLWIEAFLNTATQWLFYINSYNTCKVLSKFVARWS